MKLRLKEKDLRYDLGLMLKRLEVYLKGVALVLTSDKTLKMSEMSQKAFRSLEEYKNDILDDIRFLDRLSIERDTSKFEFTRHIDIEILLDKINKSLKILENFGINSKIEEDKDLIFEILDLARDEISTIVEYYNLVSEIRGWKRLRYEI